MKCIKIMFLLWCIVSAAPAYPKQLWGYYLKNSMPYQKYTHYWDTRFGTLTVLCFTGITIHDKGCSIPSFEQDSPLFAKAQKLTIALVPHVAFTSVKAGTAFLSSQKHWQQAIVKLTDAIRQNRWAGCHFDFEYLPPEYIHKLINFLKTFRAIAPDIKLSLALFPQLEFLSEHAAFHDYRLLAPYCDEIVLMCYDYHTPKTKPGPVTSVQWTQKNLQYALQYFKPHQIWLGIPAYGYIWKNDRYYTVITMKSLPQYISIYSNYRHNSGNVCLEYTQNNDRFIAYVPDAKLHNELFTLAVNYKLKGIALWRLGFE